MGKLLNLAGKIIGTRRVLRRGVNPYPGQTGGAYWTTYCDPELGGCGTTKDMSSQHLRQGSNCTCQSVYTRYRDWSRHVNGNLKVLSVIHRRHQAKDRRGKLWLCECLNCGEEFEATGQELGGHGKNPPRNSCGKCDRAEKARPVTGPAHYTWKGGWSNTRIERTCAYANRRAKKRGDRGRLSLEFVLELWKEQEEKCYYCGVQMLLEEKKPESVEVDHMVPTNKRDGGKNVPENICLSCHACNSEKRARVSEEYLKWRKDNGLVVRENNGEKEEA